MKKSFVTFIFVFISLSLSISLLGQTKQDTNKASSVDYAVIPLPQSIEWKNGKPFTINENTCIVYPAGNDSIQRIAMFLSEYLQFTTGKKLATSSNTKKANAIVLSTNLSHSNKEAYQLAVNDQQITINGASSAGLFYGVQTLRKSIGVSSSFPLYLEPVQIDDYPRFGYRGMHLDVSRHMFSIEFIKAYIDILALHNMNRFHWHISDDQGWRIEIKKYPKLTEVGSYRKETVIGRNSGKYDGVPYGGFYTQDEAREIVKYAQDRFITVIPEIDLPGHMLAALTAYPELGCTGGPYEVATKWGVFDEVLCAGNDSVYTFLENVLTEIMDIFPSQYIHIGGDECPKTSWEKCPKCQAKIQELGLEADTKHSAEDRLQSYVITTIEQFINKSNRKIIGWDEILEGGLAPNATVMSWRGMEGATSAVKQGNKAIMTPVSHMYFDYYQTLDTDNVPLAFNAYLPLERVYSFNPIPKGLNEAETKNIIGVQANLWTEYIPSTQQAEYMLMPRIDALAEVQWTHGTDKDYLAFTKRLERMLKFYDAKGYNYSKSMFDLEGKTVVDNINNSTKVILSTIDDSPIYYTLDGSIPTTTSLLYTKPIEISDECQIKASSCKDGIMLPKIYAQEFVKNKATRKPIKTNIQPNSNYAFGGINSLVDGILGNPKSYKDGSWLGFTAGNLEIEIDLLEETEISNIEVNTSINTLSWIFGATAFTVSTSTNGVDYKVMSTASYPISEGPFVKIETLTADFPPTLARYVKIQIDKVNEIPKWHSGAGKTAFIFIDEVRIN